MTIHFKSFLSAANRTNTDPNRGLLILEQEHKLYNNVIHRPEACTKFTFVLWDLSNS